MLALDVHHFFWMLDLIIVSNCEKSAKCQSFLLNKAYTKQRFNIPNHFASELCQTLAPSHYIAKFGVYLGRETSEKMGNQSQVSQWMAENPARIKTTSVGHNWCSETVLDVKVLKCSLIQNMQNMILLVQLQSLVIVFTTHVKFSPL